MVLSSFSVFLAALNFSLSLATFLGNVLILFALRKVNSIRPQTKLLFQCLAVTDLAVGLAAQPLLAITFILGAVKRNIILYIYHVSIPMGFVLQTVSVLTTTAICVDRLLALLLGLRYPQIVTFRRVRLVLFCFWLLSSVIIGLRYSTGYVETARSILIALMLLSLLVSLASYAKIYRRLRHQQQQVQIHVPQPQPQPRNGEAISLNIARYMKTVSSIVYVQLALARSILIALMLLSLLVSLASYAKIYRRLRHQQQRVQIHVPQPQPQPRNGEAISLNIARYKKTVSSIVCVQLAQGFCYLPYMLVGMLLTNGIIPPTARGSLFLGATITILCLNSTLNPILYCWRIREVKQAVKSTIRQLSLC
ncbi:unnamed protein product [Pocillopora meandrina]|uniref:G-protein coupled receptors family 1 profile domain-containing protein n=1 Tax=Pocillopora meandrina TaxID=46732 RepID=A0AAU9XU25_9CNID|nr:unnamed protein product [Pocillopora meandrina]